MPPERDPEADAALAQPPESTRRGSPPVTPDAPAADVDPPPPAGTGPHRVWLAALAVVLVAVNLRTAVTSLGALLSETSDGVGLSPAAAGVATMLPPLCFAAAGSFAPWLARRIPPARLVAATMAVLAVGLLARAVTGAAPVFLAASAVALSGVAVANVLLPALVKHYFPNRVGLLTGAYTTAMMFGTSIAAAASVPVAELAGSWRVGLGGWALLAVLAVLPWLPAAVRASPARRRAGRGATAGDARRPNPARTGLGRWMALYFGCQAVNGYVVMGWLAQLFRDAGFSATQAGLLLAAVTAVALPVVFVTPYLSGRPSTVRLVAVGLSVAYLAAYVGLAVAPAGGAPLWVLLLAVGQASFPFAVTMISLRTRTGAGTVALSAFAQSTGYLLAGLGPLLVGVLYEATAGWLLPIGLLLVVTCGQLVGALAVVRPRQLEDG